MFATPAMIPHDQFHLGIWLTSVENPCWYYFSKRKNTNIISNTSFIETVDAPLKRLVKFLHHHQIRTTPSCSGHYKDSMTFQKIYNVLVTDKQKINQHGLLLKDVETGQNHLFQNKHYALPWSEQEFIHQALDYQHTGILGMKLGNRKKIRQQIQTMKEAGIEVIEKDSVTLITVHQKNEEQNTVVWSKITNRIEEIFTFYRHHSHV